MVDLRRFSFALLILSTLLGASPHWVSAEDAPAPAVDPAAKKAVGRFLQRLFGAITGETDRQPVAAESSQTNQRTNQDPVDERAVINREQRTRLRRARRMLEEGEHRAGLRLLQYLLDAEEDSLLLSDDGQWRSMHDVVQTTILRSEPSVQRTYRRLYAKIAEDRLEQARASGRLRDLAIVTRRYLATPAGEAAADKIASLMIDAGELAEAHYWHQRLRATKARITKKPSWQRKAALVVERMGEPSETRTRPSAAWSQPFGGPTHTGRAPASDPVLIERWSHPITERPELAEQITRLVEDLQDSGRACIPTAIPLAVDGKIVFRTLRGVSVVDADTGRLLWETPESASVERVLAGEPVPRPAREPGRSRLRPMSSYDGSGADRHALANLLFRDGVYGLLSSDGERVFVLEDHATLSHRPPGYYRGQPREDDPYGRDWESNRITAYDLQTGRRLWSVGGSEHSGPFKPELAGTLFHGPPVVEGDELFVIGEHRGAETLYVLDRRTGRPLWSHMLSGVTAEIQYDLVRRWWPAQPAVGQGVVFCPTTVGWMLAIDRQERRIRWAQRFTERRRTQRHSRQSGVVSMVRLNSRWPPSAPVLAGDRVLFTPSEFPDPEYHTHPHVVCLDALTGEPLWDKRKDSRLYLGGVLGETVLFVGSDHVEACRLSDGQSLWKRTLSEESGPPCGRGVITGSDYLLPLQSGELWRIDLTDGSASDKSKLVSDRPALGNLLIAQQRLVSLSPSGVTCFEDREAIEGLLSSTQDGALEARERLWTAELQMIDGRPAAAVDLLQTIELTLLDPDAAARARALLRDSLTEVIRRNLESAGDELLALEQLAETPQHRLSFRQLQAERYVTLDDLGSAFDVYWNLASSPHSLLVEDETTAVRLDRWLAARLQKVRSAMSPAEQAAVDQRITSTVDASLNGPPDSWDWWSGVLGCHPERARLEQRLAERAIESDRLAEAEIRLLRLLEHNRKPESRADALRRLVTILDDSDRTADADRSVKRHLPGIAAADPKVGALLEEWVRDRRTQNDTGPVTVPRLDWTSEEFSLNRTGSSFQGKPHSGSVAVIDRPPSMDTLVFGVQPKLQRLTVDSRSGDRVWETPLRSQPVSRYDQSTSAGALGQLLCVVHQGVLHAMSLADRKMLWRKPLELRGAAAATVQTTLIGPPQEMRAAMPFRTHYGLRRLPSEAGALVAWRPGYLCYLGRNTLTAADPLTGETLWVREGIRARTRVHGNDRHLFIIPPSPAAAFAVNVEDGSVADLPQLDSLLTTAIAVEASRVVTLDSDRSGLLGFHRQRTQLRLVDPLTKNVAWETSFPEHTRFSRLGRDQLVAVEPDGNVRLVNWTTRQDEKLGRLDAEAFRSARDVFAVADRTQVYLAVNDGSENGYWSDSFVSIPVSGTLSAFDRHGGGLNWRKTAGDQNLLLEALDHLPVLLLHSRRSDSVGPGIRAQQVHLEMLDKWTGQRLLDEKRYLSPGSFRSLEFDLAARTIDLKTYRDRLRIQPADAEPTTE